jgi:two-component system, sensor histidine kinase PdtaS
LGTLRQDLRGPLGYVLGVAIFLLALGVTASTVWFQSHFPYMAYFLAGLATCYAAGLGPATLVAGLSSLAVFFTYQPSRFFPPMDTNPVASGAVLFVVVTGCSAVLAALMRSRDRLEVERERYARLAESRDLLYREMQHRVSNNIQIVAGLLRLQSQGLQDAAAKRALTEASSRISLIARIQRQLHDQSGEPAPFRRFAEELLTDALGAAGIEGVAVEIEGGDEPLHAEQATPVSLVLLECVNNALEHAYAPGQEGLVRAVLARDGGRHVLTVTDNGRGLPEGFDFEAGKSLGLKIVRTMAAQLNGDFSIAQQHPGARCTLYFPDLG